MCKRRIRLQDRWFLALECCAYCSPGHILDRTGGRVDVRGIARDQDISISRAREVLETAVGAELMERHHVENGTPFGVVQYTPTAWGVQWLYERIEEMSKSLGNA